MEKYATWREYISILFFFLLAIAKIYAQDYKFKHEIEIGTSNDFFVWHSNSDRYYTYGIHFDFRKRSDDTNFLKKYFPNADMSYHNYGFNIQAYTPGYIADQIDAMERPFAGWSYFEYHSSFSFLNKAFKVGAEIGILGPHSYAGNIQNWFHREITGDPVLDGWDNQIGDILGINLRMEYAKTFKAGKKYDLSFVLDNSIGNIFLYTEPAILLRLGTFNNIGSSMALSNGVLSNTGGKEFFVDFSARVKLSAFNATIQGNIFEDDSFFTQDEINNLIFNAFVGANYSKEKWMFKAKYFYTAGEINSNDNHVYITISGAYRW